MWPWALPDQYFSFRKVFAHFCVSSGEGFERQWNSLWFIKEHKARAKGKRNRWVDLLVSVRMFQESSWQNVQVRLSLWTDAIQSAPRELEHSTAHLARGCNTQSQPMRGCSRRSESQRSIVIHWNPWPIALCSVVMGLANTCSRIGWHSWLRPLTHCHPLSPKWWPPEFCVGD